MYYKKILIIVLMVLLFGVLSVIVLKTTSNKEIVNKIKIFYTLSKDNMFYWIVKDENEIFEIRTSDNECIKNFENIKKYISIKEKEYNCTYEEYKVNPNVNNRKFRSISISENLHETNYIQNHIMIYDLDIDHIGKVTANVYYPNKKKGGYAFNLSENDFNTLKGIIDRFYDKNKGKQRYFINDNYCNQAIVLNNRTVLNDYKKTKSVLEIQAIMMFSNFITMKYINRQKPTTNKYEIKSSQYTKEIYKEELTPYKPSKQ